MVIKVEADWNTAESDWDTPEADWAPGKDWDISTTQQISEGSNASSRNDRQMSRDWDGNMTSQDSEGSNDSSERESWISQDWEENSILQDSEGDRYLTRKESSVSNLDTAATLSAAMATKLSIGSTEQTLEKSSAHPKSNENPSIDKQRRGDYRNPPTEMEDPLLHPLSVSVMESSQDLLNEFSFEQSRVSSIGNTYREYVKPRLMDERRNLLKNPSNGSQPVVLKFPIHTQQPKPSQNLVDKSKRRRRSRHGSRSLGKSQQKNQQQRRKVHRNPINSSMRQTNQQKSIKPRKKETPKFSDGVKQQKLRCKDGKVCRTGLTDRSRSFKRKNVPVLPKWLLSGDNPTKGAGNHAARVAVRQKPISIESAVAPSAHRTSQKHKEQYQKTMSKHHKKDLLGEECDTISDQGFEMVPFTNENGANALLCVDANNYDESVRKLGSVSVMSMPLSSKKRRWTDMWPFGRKRRKTETSKLCPKLPAPMNLGLRSSLTTPSKHLPEELSIQHDCTTVCDSSLEESIATGPRGNKNQKLIDLREKPEAHDMKIVDINDVARAGCASLFGCDRPDHISGSLFNHGIAPLPAQPLAQRETRSYAEIVEMIDTITKFKLAAKRLNVTEEELLFAVSFKDMPGGTNSATRLRVSS